MFADDDKDPCATARVTLVNERRVEAPASRLNARSAIDPTIYPARKPASFHGRPWMMDAMDVARRRRCRLVSANGADACGRPKGNAVLDPRSCRLGARHCAAAAQRGRRSNPNLTVHLLKTPESGWIGIKPYTSWDTQRGHRNRRRHNPRCAWRDRQRVDGRRAGAVSKAGHGAPLDREFSANACSSATLCAALLLNMVGFANIGVVLPALSPDLGLDAGRGWTIWAGRSSLPTRSAFRCSCR